MKKNLFTAVCRWILAASLTSLASFGMLLPAQAARPHAPAAAGIFNVNTILDTVDNIPGDGICADSLGNCSLRAAIMESNRTVGGIDTINLTNATYSLVRADGATTLGDDDGLGQDETIGDLDLFASTYGVSGEGVIINGNNAIIQAGFTPGTGIDRIFDVNNYLWFMDAGLSVTLNNLTLRYGRVHCSTFYVDPCVGGGGGAIRFDGFTNGTPSTNGGQLTLNNVTLTDNQVDEGNGGAIELINSSLTVSNSNFANNSASGVGGGGNGGAIYFNSGDLTGAGVLTINGSTFQANQANRSLSNSGNGGAIYVGSLTGSSIGGSSSVGFSGNFANSTNSEGGFGGALFVADSDNLGANTLNLVDISLDNNTSTNGGGGIYQQNNAVAPANNLNLTSLASVATNNSSGPGGGIYMNGAVNMLGNLSLEGDFYEGGGVFTGNPSQFDLFGAFQMDAGTFTAPANFSVYGNFIKNGGTFTHNGGTVVMSAVGSQNLTANSALDFNNLNVANGTTVVETVAANNVTAASLTNLGTLRKTVSGNGTAGLTGVTIANISGLTSLQIDRLDQNIPNANASLATGYYWVITPTGSGAADITLPTTPPGKSAIASASRTCYDSGDGYPFTCTNAGVFTAAGVSDATLTANPNWAISITSGPSSVSLVSLAAGQPAYLLGVLLLVAAGLLAAGAIFIRRKLF